MSAQVSSSPVSDVDPFCRESFEHPFPAYEELREAGPIVRLRRYGVWSVVRYEQVHALLNDRQNCSAIHVRMTEVFARGLDCGGAWVYIVTNRPHGTGYVGVTADIGRRIWEHRESVADGFTKRYGLKRLVYAERHDDIRTAIQREKNTNTVWLILASNRQ